MASKYFDKDRVKISKGDHKELLKYGEDYSLLRTCTCGDVRISINWVGEFNVDVPDEYCFVYVIHVENRMATGVFVKEPIQLDDYYAYESDADRTFALLRDSLRKSKGESFVEIDLSDFGEEPISKNVPKTKSKNMGAW